MKEVVNTIQLVKRARSVQKKLSDIMKELSKYPESSNKNEVYECMVSGLEGVVKDVEDKYNKILKGGE